MHANCTSRTPTRGSALRRPRPVPRRLPRHPQRQGGDRDARAPRRGDQGPVRVQAPPAPPHRHHEARDRAGELPRWPQARASSWRPWIPRSSSTGARGGTRSSRSRGSPAEHGVGGAYSVSNDGAVFRALEGEVRHALPVYGDFAISRWLQEDDLERFRKYGDRYYEGGAAIVPRIPRGAPRRARTLARLPRERLEPLGFDTDDSRDGAPRRRGGEPRRALLRGGSAAAAAEERLGGLPGSRRSHRRRRRARARGEPRRGSGASWFRHRARRRRAGSRAGARDFEGFEVLAKIGIARVANENMHKSGGSQSAGGRDHQQRRGVGDERHVGGGGVGAEAAPAAATDGRVSARFVAREVETSGMSYHFTEEFKGWHVNAKAILSPNGIATPSSPSTTSGTSEMRDECACFLKRKEEEKMRSSHSRRRRTEWMPARAKRRSALNPRRTLDGFKKIPRVPRDPPLKSLGRAGARARARGAARALASPRSSSARSRARPFTRRARARLDKSGRIPGAILARVDISSFAARLPRSARPRRRASPRASPRRSPPRVRREPPRRRRRRREDSNRGRTARDIVGS